jgi:hypothetical protein
MRMAGSLSDVGRSYDRLQGGKMILDCSPTGGCERIPDVSSAVARFTGEEPPMLALALAIRIAHAIYRPDHICLCGGIGIRLKHLIPKLKKTVESQLTSLARPGWNLTTGDDIFHAARSGEDGAARIEHDGFPIYAAAFCGRAVMPVASS